MKTQNKTAEPCSYCGQAFHGEVTAPSATCIRNLWADKAELIEALIRCEEYITALARETGNGTPHWDNNTMAGRAQNAARAVLAKHGRGQK